MKNKRNTRRGRAKRWDGRYVDGTGRKLWHRGKSNFVRANGDGTWTHVAIGFTVARGVYFRRDRYPSRAAAMKAAEAITRMVYGKATP